MTLTEPRAPRDQDAWARPVERLSASGVVGAPDDAVSGRRVAGPLQGFGQMWQKTFRVRMDGTAITPKELIATWKERFPTFWPKSGTFYAPLAGITPGEVALLDIRPVPGAPVTLSTGVMVIYADDESFTFMTPEGHTLSAWITFSAHEDDGIIVAQAQALERTSDPLDELAYVLGGSRMNDRFWQDTLRSLAAYFGVEHPAVETRIVCVDRRRQWQYARNIRYSASLRSITRMLTAPARWIRRSARRSG